MYLNIVRISIPGTEERNYKSCLSGILDGVIEGANCVMEKTVRRDGQAWYISQGEM
jgi:hypothetical protein